MQKGASDAGYIAGVLNVLLKDHIDSNYMVPGPAYTPGTFFGQEALFTTMYFVDTAVICNGGRTEEQWMAQGTGDRLWLQVSRWTCFNTFVSLLVFFRTDPLQTFWWIFL